MRYEITSHPNGGFKQSVRCDHEGCPWVILPTGDQERASQAMIQHTAAKGHALFWRTTEDLAVVTLADRTEQERRVEANRLEYKHLGGAAEDASNARPHPDTQADCPAP
ncbi:hypothetical protein [Streptomyces sp. NPDC056670]|uniref:hypothetical protein n=1 Tax=Streptomyces sp. NPDC056670 TaxID=3345904 RepID=UPI00368E5511